MTETPNILTEKDGAVGIITLNRPDAMNALNTKLTEELGQALRNMDADAEIGCIIIAGAEKYFAAGADIKEMQSKGYMDVYKEDFITATWEDVSHARTPVIAAVAGHALGGGCELAMMCDIIIAADNAKFGQPEIKLGVSPGAGGTQRMARAIGKSKTMDMVLTGRMMDAVEAERCNLVSRVVPVGELMEEARKTARKIAGMSRPAAMLTKEMVNAAYETTLSQGLKFERRLFHSMFAMEDQSEGMEAFVEKRAPHWKNR
jgi:enoyl-CoA hydratase